MANTSQPQIYYHVFQSQDKPPKNQTARGDIRQDKRRLPPPLGAVSQPDAGTKSVRAVEPTTPKSQVLRGNGLEKRTAKLTLWVEPRVKQGFQRKADREEVSLSAVCAEALKIALQEDADIHYSATLKPMIEATLDRRMAARDNRLAILLVRIYLAIEQTRSLTTNILGRQPKISPEVLNDILDLSFEDAKKKLTRRSPELETLITEVKSWLVETKTAEGKP